MNCDKCPSPTVNIVFISLGVLTVVLLMVFLVFQHIKKGGKRTLSSMQKMITISYFQVASMVASINVAWPAPLQVLFNIEEAISTIGGHLVNTDCEYSDLPAADIIYYKQIAYTLALPVLFVLTKTLWRVAACCLGKNYRSRGRGSERYGKSPSFKDKEIATIVFAVYMLYPTLCRQAFELLMCRHVDDSYYLAGDLQETCWKGRHMFYFMCCTVPQILVHVIGIPFLGVRAAKRGHFEKREKGCFRRHVLSRVCKVNIGEYKGGAKYMREIALFRYGRLYSAYNAQRWYWGAVVASRKAFIAFISRYLSDPGLQIHWIVLYFSISLMANLYFQPYMGVKGIRNEDSRKLHWTDAAGLFCLLLTAWSGLFFNMTPTCDHNEMACFFTLICVLIINIGFFLYCLYSLRDYFVKCLVPRMVIKRRGQPARSDFTDPQTQSQTQKPNQIANPMLSNTKTDQHPVLAAQSRRSEALKSALA